MCLFCFQQSQEKLTIMSFYNLLVLIFSFVGMEIFSWTFHKYIMHGILWNVHKTHHSPSKSFFELNDLFSLFFALIAIVLMIIGLETFSSPFWIGLGITLYGIVYFILHDFFIHKRLGTNRPPWNNKYLVGITKAHQAHHKSHKKEDSESFGLLFVKFKYFRHKKANKV